MRFHSNVNIKKYTPPARKPDYPEQVLEMLAILEKDHRFTDAYKAIGKDQEMSAPKMTYAYFLFHHLKNLYIVFVYGYGSEEKTDYYYKYVCIFF